MSNVIMPHKKEKEMFYKKVDALRDEAVELLRKLISIRSENLGLGRGDEKEIAEFVADYERGFGMEVRQIEPYPRRVSNVGRLEGRVGKPGLLFNSHLDTVPAGDLRKWKYPPFAGEIHDGKIYGLGTDDCKGGMAASLFMLRALTECGIKLRGDLVLSQMAGEETGGREGTEQLVMYERTDGSRGLLRGIDYGVYTEGGLRMPCSERKGRINIGQRGIVWLEITTFGKPGRYTPGHINAIIKMCDVAKAVENIQFTGVKHHPVLPFGTDVSTNIIRGGFKENVIPDECTIICDVRVVPGHTAEMVLADVNRVLDELKAEDPELKVAAKVVNEIRPWWIEPDAHIVKEIQRVGKEFGYEFVAEGHPSSGDTRFFVLDAGIQMAQGLAAIGPSHMPNEHVEVEGFITAIKMQGALTLNLLL